MIIIIALQSGDSRFRF